jgi:RimJ/RimL family protein N-acetyltransferase
MPTTGAEGGLTTERLILRPLARTDIPTIVELAGDEAVSEWTASIPHPLDAKEVGAWLDRHSATGERAFAVTLKDGAGLIGVIGLTDIAGTPRAELGYWIGRSHWGQGYATEAVRRMVLFGFTELGLARIEAGIFVGNTRSGRVLQKAGFAETGTLFRPAPARGGNRETVMYALTRIEFARTALSQAVGRS